MVRAVNGKDRLLGTLSLAAACALWGTWALFLRPSGLGGVPSAVLVFAAMSLPAPLVLRRAAFRDRGAVLALAGLGLADAGSAGLYFAALQRGPVAVATLTHYLAPVLVALAAPVVLGEVRSRRASAAAALAVLGLALLVWRPSAGFPAETALLGGASAIAYAAMFFTAKRASRAFSPLAVSLLHAPVSALALLAWGGADALPPLAAGSVWPVAGGVVLGIGGGALFYAGLRRVTSQAAGALSYLEPLVATVVGVAAFGESMDALAVAGAAVVLGSGVWVAVEPPAARALSSADAGIAGA